MDVGYIALALSVVNTALLGVVVHLWVEVKALQNSTHRIEYRDPFLKEQPEPTDLTDDEKKILQEDAFDNIM